MTGKICQICGKSSGIYPLCKEHLELKAKGLVIKNEKTGNWELKESNDIITKKDNISKNCENEKSLNCVICGEKTQNGFLFCKTHYSQYKNKTILIKITNCTDIEFVSELNKYEDGLTYTCKDGHRVRSKSEVIIDNYLYDHNLKHAYEKAYPIDNNKEHDLHPDFYLPELDLYIEHWGYANKANYNEEKDYKIKIYNQNKTTVIGTNEDDTLDIETSLNRKLKFYQKGKVN